MKKLIIAAAIVCAAAISQAAQVNWELSVKDSIKMANGDRASGVDVYLINASDSVKLAALTADLTSGKVNVDNITENDLFIGQGKTGTGNNTKGKISKIASNEVSGFKAEQGAGFYDVAFVYFDQNAKGEDMFYLSQTKKGQAWDGVNVTSDLSQQASWSSSDYSASTWKTVSAVPEPTSGLLLLLGVAGMALKRKRS